LSGDGLVASNSGTLLGRMDTGLSPAV
jgi:hypothetical protein